VLNELLVVERGARASGALMPQRHPDVKDARRVPTLLVRLDADGHVTSVQPVPSTITPWALRDGQHNSFPFIQPKHPIWAMSSDDQRREDTLNKKRTNRRRALIDLARDAELNVGAFDSWPGRRLLNRLRERRVNLTSLERTDAAAVPMSIDRFLRACDSAESGDPHRLLREIAAELVTALHQTTGDDWIDVAVAVLLEGSGALVFDAAGSGLSVLAPQIPGRVSSALQGQPTEDETAGARCGLTGRRGTLVTSKFPQPNLPLLGQTYLFARNKDTPANGRYSRLAADTMPVSEDAAVRLSAALTALTAAKLRGKTWRSIPGEAPQQSDLLVAFVEALPDSPLTDVLAEDSEDEDLSEERAETALGAADSVATFEKRCERMIKAVQAVVTADFRETPVRLVVLRKVDPANRKVVYTGAPTVGSLYDAAMDWVAGERNVPMWLTLPVLRKGERKARPMLPPHIAPLGVIGFSKQLFLRGGTQRQEIVGMPASEVLALFLDTSGTSNDAPRRGVHRVLRLVLARRSSLVSGTAHELRRGFDKAKGFDRREVLRTITLLGVLLHKLGRTKTAEDHGEDYMSDTAFKLGQLLAAADVVHVGYCADVRGGEVPPSLLGNQVFTMAQTAPAKALATLCRRWKPYDGWAMRATHLRSRANTMAASKESDEQQRGWEIRTALRYAREMRALANDLAPALAGLDRQEVNDVFRAELLLGYIAGLPKARKEEESDEQQATQTTGQES